MGDLSTPEYRLRMWGSTALDLVRDLQKYHKENPDESVPWRIAYMSGIREIAQYDKDHYVAKIYPSSGSVKRSSHVLIPKEGDPSNILLKDLCWHLDQDVKRYDEQEQGYESEMPYSFPRGEILVDKVLAYYIDTKKIDVYNLRYNIYDSPEYKKKERYRIYIWKFGNIEIHLHKNRLSAKFIIPETKSVWNNGHLRIEGVQMPEIMKASSAGRYVHEIVDHEVFRSTNLKITYIKMLTNDQIEIRTDANKSENLVGI